MAQKKFSVNLPEEMHKALRMAAVETDTTVSHLASEVLTRWLEAYDTRAVSLRRNHDQKE